MKIIVWFSVLMMVFFGYSCTSGKGDGIRYIFFLIGDGMGNGQVTGTQFYRAELDGRIGLDSLSFTGFPVVNMMSTYSAFNAITCSAAAGTALATGTRTSNGTIGKDAIHSKDVYSIAVKAKEKGLSVGITTSVSIDHATPAVFYAHQSSRSMYYEIAMDAVKTGFDLYAGSGFLQTRSMTDSTAPDVYRSFEDAGYTIARGYDDFNRKREKATKMVFVQETGASPFSLPYAIDRKPGDLTLSEITRGAIDYLFQKSNKGFKRIDNGDIITTNNTTTTTPPPSSLSSSSSIIKPNKLQPNQETIYRDSSGRIINDIKQRQEDLQQQKLHEEQLKQFTEIKTSKQDQINQEQEIFKVKNGHVDNQFEDPMTSFIKDTTTTKKEFEDVSKSKFVYNKGINIPNRFNIPAGYFWDGIDRSNGFEQMYLRKQTEYNYDKIDSKINETYEIDIGDD